MTDHEDLDRAERHDRAERALARAFEVHAGDHDFAPLDPEALKSRALDAGGTGSRRGRGRGRRKGWLPAVAAVVVLVLGVPIAAVLVGRMGATPTSALAPEAAPAPDFEAGTTAAGPDAGRGTTDTGGAASAPEGWRSESMLDVAILVPADWGYGFAPGSDWCAEPGHQRPDTPFVDRNPLSRAVHSILCTQPLPDALRQTHLTWRPAEPGDADGTVLAGAGEWRQVNRVVGSAFLTVEVRADEIALAEQILTTARVDATDPRGCPVAWPGRPTTGAVDDLPDIASVTVCQYVLDADRPGASLAGSRDMAGDDARGLAAAIAARPTLADAVGEPTTCEHGEALLIRLVDAAGAAHDVTLVTGVGCGPFGLDDGVRLRQPSRATCADLFAGPLWQAAFDERTAEFCSPR